MAENGTHTIMARLDRLIDTVGNGSGLTEMSALAADYFVRPGPTEFMEIARVLTVMEDNAKFAAEKYSAAGALGTGIFITKEDASGVLHNYTPQPIKKIGHWGLLAGVDVYLTNFTTGNDMFIIRWTLSKAEHRTTLDGRRGEFFRVSVKDSLADAASHIMSVQGSVHWVS